jgi:hypothetical protein
VSFSPISSSLHQPAAYYHRLVVASNEIYELPRLSVLSAHSSYFAHDDEHLDLGLDTAVLVYAQVSGSFQLQEREMDIDPHFERSRTANVSIQASHLLHLLPRCPVTLRVQVAGYASACFGLPAPAYLNAALFHFSAPDWPQR